MANVTASPDAVPRGGMTIRIYTVNRYGTVIAERGTVNVLPSEGPPPLSTVLPACGCPGCRKTRAAEQ
ncbi:hypothetical protein ABT288_01385 [Streptomyces sp. NPDC001093]|uniref:hypothetical protein n=1 Tax=Streptomyces sp. NPDC001093 TaxID=3154376 RepID=UPI0033230830